LVNGDRDGLNFTGEFYITSNNFTIGNNRSFRNNKRQEYKNKGNFGGFIPQLTSYDINPFNNKNKDHYDPKSFVYLKRISENNNVTEQS
jgi:hypothetical protein